ncbi:multicopper oxidase family protein [Streptomyces huasconensis]|uniref:multicopper oxidase family protein n=1 Tax=Streptomyces huasconensis TaxID=1854574 RepID=UPI0033C0337E
MSRRGFLGLTAGTGAALIAGATGYAHLTQPSTGRILHSTGPVPEPFQVPLPLPPAARPARTEAHADFYDLEQREGQAEILPGRTTTVWGYDGIFPGPTFTARSGRRTVIRVRNMLTVPTAMHLHGGVTPPESDGYPTDLVLPTRRGPGHNHHHPAATPGSHSRHTDPMAGDTTTAERTYTYPLPQRAATLWYHDHRMDFSAPQVWRGLAGMFIIRDQEEDRLPLPGGDRDIPLMLTDRSFEADGSFRYPALDPTCTRQPGVQDAYMDGVLGDIQLVNGAPWPELEVSTTRYRLRLLNASNARRYQLRLDTEDGGAHLPFVQIGSDGGLLAAPQRLDTLAMAPAERFDVVIDFSALPVGTHITLVNTAAQGRMGQVMRFHIVRRQKDDSRVPARLSAFDTLTATHGMPVRSFDFRRTGDDEQQMWTINGQPFHTSKVWARPRLGSVERWRFSSDFHHPVHLHLAQFQVLARGNKPPQACDAGWKDTVDVRPYEVVEVLARFDGYRGRYMLHCHNLEHEDMAMMANFEVI